MCGGLDQGECVCGECHCNPGWSGEVCQCRDDQCIDPITNLVCAGHGNCKCGQYMLKFRFYLIPSCINNNYLVV